jgi:hypothetical protein
LRLATGYKLPDGKLSVPVRAWVADKTLETGAERIDWRLHADSAISTTVEGATHENILTTPAFLSDLKSALAAMSSP